jgi:hypothetical protein
LVPDAPIDLTTDLAVTDTTTIRFTWSEGVSNGGASVIDYDVLYDQANGDGVFVELAAGVVNSFY